MLPARYFGKAWKKSNNAELSLEQNELLELTMDGVNLEQLFGENINWWRMWKVLECNLDKMKKTKVCVWGTLWNA